MRICFINILYSKKDERGGQGAHIADLSLALSKRGHEVTVITSGKGEPYYDHSVKVIPLGKVDKYSRPSQLLNPIYLFQRLSYMFRMTKFVLKSDFDVVEAAEGGFEHLFLLLFRRCALITKLHGNFRYIYAQKNLLADVIEKLEAWAVSKSDGIYTSSVAYAKSLSNDYKIPLERIKIIPYGIDVSEMSDLRRIDLKQEYPVIKDKKLILLSVGSSPVRKGAPVFIEAASKLKQETNLFFILLCGDKRFLDQTKIPDNLLILPNLDRRQYYSWISCSDIVVFPTRFESFLIALREAMLFNKAVIISAHVPLEGIDREYPKYSVLQKIDPALLAEAILEMANGDEGDSEIDGEFHRVLKDKYDIGRVADTTIAFYEEIIEAYKKGLRF